MSSNSAMQRIKKVAGLGESARPGTDWDDHEDRGTTSKKQEEQEDPGKPGRSRNHGKPERENVVLILRRLFLTIMPQTGVLRRNSGCRGHSAKSNLFPRDANRDLCHKPTVRISSAPTVVQWNVIAQINVSFLKHILYHMFYIIYRNML